MHAFVKLALVATAVATLPTCRILQPEKYAQIRACAATIPILRSEPQRPYRIIRVYAFESEERIAYEACRENADAVLVQGPSRDFSVSAWGVKSNEKVRGAAIRYTDGER